jgi:hypothetical protein
LAEAKKWSFDTHIHKPDFDGAQSAIRVPWQFKSLDMAAI